MINRVSNTDEAQDELCNGSLFLVDGQFLAPSHVVRMTENSSGYPQFHLADGTTLTHDPFQPGETGDLLADALPRAVRADNQSQKIKPAVNRVLSLESGEQQLQEIGGKIVRKFSGTPADDMGMHIGAGYVAGFDLNTPELRLYDYSDGSIVGTFSAGADVNGYAHVVDSGNGYFFARDNNDNLFVVRISPDGSTTAPINGEARSNYTTVPYAQAIRGTDVYGADGAAFFLRDDDPGSSIGRVDFDTGTEDIYANVNADALGGAIGMAIDEDAGTLYVQDAGTVQSVPTDNVNATPETLYSVGEQLFRFDPSESRFLHRENGNVYVYDRSGKLTRTVETQASNLRDADVDLSVV